MLVALCDNWPVAEMATIVVEEAPLEPVTAAGEPRILPVRWGSTVPGQESAEASRPAVGSDAA
jgi:hypothetical protein